MVKSLFWCAAVGSSYSLEFKASFACCSVDLSVDPEAALPEAVDETRSA
jgi:hypothetical protein